MFRSVRVLAMVSVALFAMLVAATPSSATWLSTGHADFSATDGGSVVGGSYVITDARGVIVRQDVIGDGEAAIFFSTFEIGETYTMTVVADGYQTWTQSLEFSKENNRFIVVLEPLKLVKKTITIGIDKNAHSAEYLTGAPEGSTWMLTNTKSGKQFSGTFSGALPQSIELSSAIGSGTYAVEIDAGPNFLLYEGSVTIRGNSGALYFPLEVNEEVVPAF